MGGSSGSKYTGDAVSAADTLSLTDIYSAANESAATQLEDRVAAIQEYYPQIMNTTLDTVKTVSNTLSDTADYKASKTALENATAAVADMKTGENRISGLADATATEAYKALASSGPTSIESELYRQGEADLALGRSLSAEQERMAQQSARGAFAARGLGTSLGATASEILNRDMYGQNRLDARRQFAATANNLRENNVTSRRDQAAALAGQSGNLSANQSSIAGNRASLGTGISSGYTSINPYRYALATTSPYVSSVLNSITDTTNSAYDTATDTSSNVASFNANMLDTRYNNYQNNLAATNAANTYASASNYASNIGLIGTLGSAALGAGAKAATTSDRREKTDIKALGKAGGVLGLTAYQYRMKGDDKMRVGFMAQDVKKVLPEAVTTTTVRGKRRLAIKPQVIGAALARELMDEGNK